jgi:eukaryotic-like serine/threonine-protein kinase
MVKVFISSTKKDLSRHREAVTKALRKNDYFPVEMEDFGARDVDPVTGCLRLVAESRLFIGIYAWRYGYVPPGAARSITAEELEQARRLGKPRFYFLVDESYPWPASPDVPEESPERRELLRALKDSLLSEQMVAFFTTPDQLALEVVTALRRWELAQAPAHGRRRQLLDLLDEVERYWVKSVLMRSVQETGLLSRDREDRPDEVAQPWEPPAWAERGAAKLLPPRTPLDLFVASGRRLLILGEGGYGKTTDLLQLAGGLVELARDDSEQPVPVVLKLGSWGRMSRHLAGWMGREIHAHYKLDLALVRSCIDGDSLLPLLDGLDEVEPRYRNACARAINEFLADHPACGLAVSCRSDVNDELGERLDLRSAYALWPLSAAALERYLAAGGPGAEPLRAAVAQQGWRELACTPLLLVMMERILRGAGAAGLDAAPAPPAKATPGSGAGPRQLLTVYVQVMLQQSARPLRFAAARTRRGLAWLACQMSTHRLALFQLDELQPSWLRGSARVWAYAVASRAFGGALLLLPIALLRPAAFLVPVGLAAGAFAGLLDGRRLRNTSAAPAAGANEAKAPGAPEPLVHRPAARAVAIGGAAMLCFSLFAGLSQRAAGELNWRLDLPEGLRYGLFYGVLFGLVFGLRLGRRERGDTEISAGLTRSGWSWSKSRRGAGWPLALVALLWLIECLRSWLGVNSRFGLLFCLLLGLVASTVGGVVGGLLGDLEEEPAGTARRHPGLRPALAGTARVGGRALLMVAAALWAVLLLLALVFDVQFGAGEWRAPAFAALALGWWSALALRGLDLVQHFTLRLLLWCEGIFPLRWVRFLDQAVDCNLMHRVGPGYEFIHPWLLAELAAGAPSDPNAGSAAAEPARKSY